MVLGLAPARASRPDARSPRGVALQAVQVLPVLLIGVGAARPPRNARAGAAPGGGGRLMPMGLPRRLAVLTAVMAIAARDRRHRDRALVVGAHPARGLPAGDGGAGQHARLAARPECAAWRHRQPRAGPRGVVAPPEHGIPGHGLRAARAAARARRRERRCRDSTPAGALGVRRASPAGRPKCACAGGRSPGWQVVVPLGHAAALRGARRAGLDAAAAGLGPARAPAGLPARPDVGAPGGAVRGGHDGALGRAAAGRARHRHGRRPWRRHGRARRARRSARRSSAS